MVQNILPAHDFVFAGIQLRVYYANAGEGLAKHNHTFTHGNFCMDGSYTVHKEGKDAVVNKHTQPINLAPYEWHEIDVTKDGTVWVTVFADKYKYDDLPILTEVV